MDGGVLSIGLTLTGVVIALAGIGYFAGHVADEVAAAAAVAAGLALAGVAWLPVHGPVPAPAPVAPDRLVISPALNQAEIAPAATTGPPPLPGREAARISVEAREAEPNDTLPGANLAGLGVSVDGMLEPGDRDWFAIDVPAGTRGKLVANLVTEDASVTMTLFDDAGQTLGIAATLDEIRVRTATLERKLDSPRFYVLLLPSSYIPARYQLTLAARRW